MSESLLLLGILQLVGFKVLDRGISLVLGVEVLVPDQEFREAVLPGVSPLSLFQGAVVQETQEAQVVRQALVIEMKKPVWETSSLQVSWKIFTLNLTGMT